MNETPDDVDALRRLLDASYAGAGPHLRSILSPDVRMTAEAVCALLTGIRHVALATVTAAGEPLVTPVDALFLRGRLHGLTTAGSVRAKHLAVRPAVSATYFETDVVAVTVHGTATLVGRDHPGFAEVDAEVRRLYGDSLLDWTPTPVAVRVEPRVMFAYDRRGAVS